MPSGRGVGVDARDGGHQGPGVRVVRMAASSADRPAGGGPPVEVHVEPAQSERLADARTQDATEVDQEPPIGPDLGGQAVEE